MNLVLSSVFGKTLYDRRRGLAGWSAGVVVATLLILALWPTVRGMDDLPPSSPPSASGRA